MRFGAALIVAVSMFVLGATGASAADSIYWTNYNSVESVSVANLDGSGAGRDLFTSIAGRGGTVNAPAGLALDPANGLAYWTNTNSKVTRGSLDGCDAAATCATDIYPLPAGGPEVTAPGGPALDLAHGLMYWMNSTGTLLRASLDGSGAISQAINTAGASALGAGGAGGLVIDPRTSRIYWTSDDFANPGKISWANLDGSGGGDLNTTGATVDRPWGIAIDTATNRAYWSSYEGADGNIGAISWANLDGTGGGDLYTSASPGCSMISGPNGVAIDHAANKIYWASFSDSAISSANLDGSGGCANIAVPGASLNGPDEVALLKAPSADLAPTITASGANKLSCGTGTWGGDSPEAAFYRAPRSFSYEWRKSGVVVAGASTALLAPTSSGSYSCTVTATNNAGATTGKASAPVKFKRDVRLSASKFKTKARGGKLRVSGKVSAGAKPKISAKDCKGSVAVKITYKKKRVASKRFALKYKRGKCSANVSLKLAQKYAGKRAKLALSIGSSKTLAAKPRTSSVRL